VSEHYITVAYDRRSNAGSRVVNPGPLNPIQSACDVVAIIEALGFSKTSIFGASSGGIIALQVAAGYPEYVEHVVIHETPTIFLMVGGNSEQIDSLFAVYGTHKARGTVAAAQQFSASVRSKAKSKLVKADL
jgi:pimeloyl-ACP methyl ester carboxylesterase